MVRSQIINFNLEVNTLTLTLNDKFNRFILLTAPFLLDFPGSLSSAHSLFLSLLLGAALVKILNDHAYEHVQHKEADQQQKRDKVDEHPLVVVLFRLHINAHRVDSRVHYLHPAVLARQDEQRHQRLAEVVEVVLGVEPLVSLIRQTVLFRHHVLYVLACTVVELALEQLKTHTHTLSIYIYQFI